MGRRMTGLNAVHQPGAGPQDVPRDTHPTEPLARVRGADDGSARKPNNHAAYRGIVRTACAEISCTSPLMAIKLLSWGTALGVVEL